MIEIAKIYFERLQTQIRVIIDDDTVTIKKFADNPITISSNNVQKSCISLCTATGRNPYGCIMSIIANKSFTLYQELWDPGQETWGQRISWGNTDYNNGVEHTNGTVSVFGSSTPGNACSDDQPIRIDYVHPSIYQNTTNITTAQQWLTLISQEPNVYTVNYSIPKDNYEYARLTYKKDAIPDHKDDGTCIDLDPNATSIDINSLDEGSSYYFMIFTNKSESPDFKFTANGFPEQ